MMCIPFQVVRRQGRFVARADGLAQVIPDRFKRTKTGDWLLPNPQIVRYYRWGSYRQSEAAITFERFIRRRFGVNTKLERTSDASGARVDWLLWIRS